MQRLLRVFRDTAGANLLEAAIITPLLLLLTFAIVDCASLFYAYLALENGVSQATRFAVTGNTKDDPGQPGAQMSRADSIKAALREATPTLRIPDNAISFSHLPQGAQNWVGGVGAPNEIEKLSVDYTWSLMTPLLRPFFDHGEIHLRVDSAMKNEGRFQ
jgi:hypothetical protein